MHYREIAVILLAEGAASAKPVQFHPAQEETSLGAQGKENPLCHIVTMHMVALVCKCLLRGTV